MSSSVSESLGSQYSPGPSPQKGPRKETPLSKTASTSEKAASLSFERTGESFAPLHISDLDSALIKKISESVSPSELVQFGASAVKPIAKAILETICENRRSSMAALSQNQELRTAYTLLYGEEIPALEEITTLDDTEVFQYIKDIRERLENSWNPLPQSVKNLFGEISFDAIERNPEKIIDVLRAVRYHNLACVGKGLKLIPSDHIFMNKEDLFAAGERIVDHLNKSPLVSLRCQGVEMTEIPLEVTSLTTLKHLDVSNNKLTFLPESIGKLTNLKSLILSHNFLSELPDPIGDLKKLKWLFADHNTLLSVPERMSKLKLLTTLGLSHNHLTALSFEIGELKYLETLYLNDNRLTSLPPSLSTATQIRFLELENNHLPGLFGGTYNLQMMARDLKNRGVTVEIVQDPFSKTLWHSLANMWR